MGGPAGKQVDGTTWFLLAWASVTQWFQVNPQESFQSNDSFHLLWLCLEQAHIFKKESRYLSQYRHIANILFLQQQILSAKFKCYECGLVETLSLQDQNSISTRLKTEHFMKPGLGTKIWNELIFSSELTKQTVQNSQTGSGPGNLPRCHRVWNTVSCIHSDLSVAGDTSQTRHQEHT